MTNPYIQELIARIDRRFSVDSTTMTLGDWITQNTTIRGKPFSFSDYAFQKQIVDDEHPNLDCIKPSQVGLSECQVRKTLGFLARNRGTTAIFTLPTEQMMKRTSTTRILPIVQEDQVFNLETRTGEKPARSMGLIQVGTSFMFVTAANENAATSIAADMVMIDEIDLSDQKMVALFQSRLQNSSYKISQRFSTPTFSNFGIDKGFSVSDQHEYLCRCLACNHWNNPVFQPQFLHIPGMPSDINDLTELDVHHVDEGMDLLNAYVKCEKCSAPLPLGDSSYREWVPQFPTRDHHRGYRVSPFSTDRLSIQYIVTALFRYKDRDFLRGWRNTVLGEAFIDGNSRLSEADISACFTGQMSVPDVDPHKPTWIGLDIGQTCHGVVAQGDHIDDLHVVRFETIPVKNLVSWVEEMQATYNLIGGAVDRFPYTPQADELRDITQGKIVPVEYRGQKPLNFVKDPVTEDVTHVQANRTQAMDTVARAVRRKLVRFSGYGSDKSVITEHLRDQVRDESPEKEATWTKLTGNDHFAHALIFLLLGIQLKDTQRQLFEDPRSTIALLGVNTPGLGSNLIGQVKNSSGLWNRI